MSLVECDKFKLHKSCLVVTGTIMISGFCVLLTLSRYLGGQHNIEQLLNLLHLVWSSVLCCIVHERFVIRFFASADQTVTTDRCMR